MEISGACASGANFSATADLSSLLAAALVAAEVQICVQCHQPPLPRESASAVEVAVIGRPGPRPTVTGIQSTLGRPLLEVVVNAAERAGCTLLARLQIVCRCADLVTMHVLGYIILHYQG